MPNLGPEYARAFERIYPELAAKYGVLLYPFFLAGSAADLTLRQADGLHPNAAGVNAIVAHIFPKVQELITQIRN
jgi:acyl-CoA thioesterase-1